MGYSLRRWIHWITSKWMRYKPQSPLPHFHLGTLRKKKMNGPPVIIIGFGDTRSGWQRWRRGGARNRRTRQTRATTTPVACECDGGRAAACGTSGLCRVVCRCRTRQASGDNPSPVDRSPYVVVGFFRGSGVVRLSTLHRPLSSRPLNAVVVRSPSPVPV